MKKKGKRGKLKKKESNFGKKTKKKRKKRENWKEKWKSEKKRMHCRLLL